MIKLFLYLRVRAKIQKETLKLAFDIMKFHNDLYCLVGHIDCLMLLERCNVSKPNQVYFLFNVNINYNYLSCEMWFIIVGIPTDKAPII